MNYLAIAIFIVLSLVGFLGIIIPGLPDMIFILLGILIYGILTYFAQVSLNLLILTGILVLFCYLLDYLGVILGAKKFGASKYGIIGAILGGVIGLIVFNIFGFIIGAILGTTLFEITFAKKEFHKAFRASVGALLGLLFSVVLKIIIGVVIIGLFLRAIL